MELVSAGVEILTPINGEEILKHIERCGRVCYKSEDRITDGSAERFVAGLIRRGHESVLEHYSITVKFVCDRGVSHEIVRHRIASYSQESTRYCDYSGGITFVWPCYLTAGTDEAYDWINACGAAEKAYKRMIADGLSPQQARTVLPNGTKTELIMTANLREWRTVLKQRTAKAAHPQMREVMLMLLNEFRDRIPIVFDDIEVKN